MDTFKRPPSSSSRVFERKAVCDRNSDRDIFPCDVLDSCDRFTTLDDIPNIDDVVPFTSFLIRSQMRYKILDLNSHLKDHFSYVMRRLEKPGAECRRITRRRLEKRLSKPFDVSNKKNADVRLGYRWKNVFFVKYLFTFGVRQTGKDEIHLLQTSEAPLWYFQSKNGQISGLKSLDFLSERKFSEHKLLPKRVYAIKENVRYAILAVRKTKFSIHRCTSRLLPLLPMASEVMDPRMDGCDYSVPPPTPSLDRDAKWDDDDELEMDKTETPLERTENENFLLLLLLQQEQPQPPEDEISVQLRQQLQVKEDLARIEENILYLTSPVPTMDLESIDLDESLLDSERLDALFSELVPANI